MFSQKVVDSDAFLDMPLSSQALYFHLGMRADDDGFVDSPKKIQRMIGATQGDFETLMNKGFVIPFDSGVCVIKHWLMHNSIRKDRYTPTAYQEEKSSLYQKDNGAYTLAPPPIRLPAGNPLSTNGQPDGCQDGNQSAPQVRIGKDRLGKDRIEEDRVGEFEGEENPPDDPHVRINYEQIKTMYNKLCPSYPRCTALSDARKKAIKARFASGYTMEDFMHLFQKVEASSFLKGQNSRNWRASFDWLLKDSSMAKVLDGNYDDAGAAQPAQQRMDDLDFLL